MAVRGHYSRVTTRARTGRPRRSGTCATPPRPGSAGGVPPIQVKSLAPAPAADCAACPRQLAGQGLDARLRQQGDVGERVMSQPARRWKRFKRVAILRDSTASPHAQKWLICTLLFSEVYRSVGIQIRRSARPDYQMTLLSRDYRGLEFAVNDSVEYAQLRIGMRSGNARCPARAGGGRPTACSDWAPG